MWSTLRTTLPTLFALLLGFGLMQMGNTLQGTLLSVRGGLEGFSPAQIGAVGAGFWVGIVIGSLYGGAVISRVGHIRTFAALAAIASTAALLHLLFIEPLVWIISRALTGFCFAGLFMVVESWLNGAATPQTRGQILSLYGMTGLMAGIAGQLLLPSNDPSGFRLFCLVAIILSFALVPISLSRAAAPVLPTGGSAVRLRRLYGASPFGVVAAFLCGVSTSTFFSLGPVLAQRLGLDTGEIALFMASGTLGGFLMVWPLGWISDRVDRRTVIIAAAIVAATTLTTLVAVVPEDAPPWVLYLCVALFGGTIVPTYSIVLAHVNDMVAPGEFVAASGGLLIVQGVGSAVGPMVAGLAMSAFTYGLSATVVLAQVMMALWGAHRMRRRSAPAEPAKEPFIIEPAVPVGTGLASAHVEGR